MGPRKTTRPQVLVRVMRGHFGSVNLPCAPLTATPHHIADLTGLRGARSTEADMAPPKSNPKDRPRSSSSASAKTNAGAGGGKEGKEGRKFSSLSSVSWTIRNCTSSVGHKRLDSSSCSFKLLSISLPSPKHPHRLQSPQTMPDPPQPRASRSLGPPVGTPS